MSQRDRLAGLPVADYGLDQAVAEYLKRNGPSIWRLYSEAPTGVPGETVIFVGWEEASPTTALTVFLEGGGTAIAKSMGESHSFTVRSRAPTYDESWQNAKRVQDLLQGAAGKFDDAGAFQVLDSLQENFPPTPLGKDSGEESGAWRWTQTFTAFILRTRLN